MTRRPLSEDEQQYLDLYLQEHRASAPIRQAAQRRTVCDNLARHMTALKSHDRRSLRSCISGYCFGNDYLFWARLGRAFLLSTANIPLPA